MSLRDEFAEELVKAGAPERFAQDNADALVAVLTSPPWFDAAVQRMLRFDESQHWEARYGDLLLAALGEE